MDFQSQYFLCSTFQIVFCFIIQNRSAFQHFLRHEGLNTQVFCSVDCRRALLATCALVASLANTACTARLPRPSVSPEGLWECTHTPDITCVSYLEKYQNTLMMLIVTFTIFPLLFQPSPLLLGRSRTALDCMIPIYLPSFTPGNWFRHVCLQKGPFS